MVSWADLIIFCETQFTQVKNEDNNASWQQYYKNKSTILKVSGL